MSTIEETVSCELDDGWLWVHGWIDKRRFKGECLSQVDSFEYLRSGFDDENRRAVAAGSVHHGYVITVEGDMSGCGWDTTMYFEETEPTVVEIERRSDPLDPETMGRVRVWHGASEYVDLGDADGERPATVLDGPHKATWLKPKGRAV